MTSEPNTGPALDIETIAYHEAGHAVAAFRLRRRFSYVTIEPDPGGNYVGKVERPDDALRELILDGACPKITPGEIERLDRDIMVELAGFVAEIYYTTGEEKYNAAGADYEKALHLALPVVLHQMRENDDSDEIDLREVAEWHVYDLGGKTIPIITRESWPLVEALASALLEQRTIRYMRAREIMKTADG